MVENGADTWNVGRPKKIYVSAKPSHFNKLEETLLTGCLKPPGTCHHVQNQSRRKRRRTTHGFLRKCQPPACQGISVATTDRSGRTQCQAEKTGNVEQVTRWQDSKTEQRRSSAFGRKPQCVVEQHKSIGSHRLAIFATLPTAKVERGHSYLNGTDNMQLSSPARRLHPRGKNGKGRDCLAEQLVTTWWQWCQTST